MNLRTKAAALLASGALVLAISGTAAAATYATVAGHQGFSADANQATYWDDFFDLAAGSCTKVEGDALTAAENGDQYTASFAVDYAHVVVASAGQSTDNTNTLFDNVTAGELVFADTDGSNDYTSSHDPDDKAISHIIVCAGTESSTSSSSTTSSTTSFTGSQSGETDVPSQPNTATIANSSSGPSNGAWLLIAALGALVGSIVVLTPARAKNRR